MKLLVCDLGHMPYVTALDLQRAVARARIEGTVAEDVLLLVEHPPVVTLGRSSKAQHLLASAALLAARGVELHEVERGGDVTFHGPGQLVGYLIVDLKRHKLDLHWYLRTVEAALIDALAPLGIVGERRAGFTGVWTGGRKLASIGVHARDWVTWHGFALNVTTDLSYFDLIVPCGIRAVEMTSITRELEHFPSAANHQRDGALQWPCGGGSARDGIIVQTLSRCVAVAFGKLFGLGVAELALNDLERMISPEGRQSSPYKQ